MLIFFCSPLRGEDKHRNIVWAQDSCREISKTGAVAFAPHLYFTQFLDDDVPEERDLGINSGLCIMALANEVWFYLPPWRAFMSEGMQKEIANARQKGFTVVVITNHDEWEANLARVRHLCTAAA